MQEQWCRVTKLQGWKMQYCSLIPLKFVDPVFSDLALSCLAFSSLLLQSCTGTESIVPILTCTSKIFFLLLLAQTSIHF